MTILCAELFSGAGLLGHGFHTTGFESIFAAELDDRAVGTYNTNLEPVAEKWDVTIVKQQISYDVLLAGPPCQGFSSLGRRDPADQRNNLSLIVLDWALVHNPKVVVIENVPQFLKSKQRLFLIEGFERLGYECVTWTLNAVSYGVPQNRIRSFTIFSLLGLPEKPQESPEIKTVRDAFEGLSSVADGRNFHIAPEPSALGKQRFNLIPPSGDKRDILLAAPDLCPPSWHKMGCAAVDVWGRMSWGKPSNTLRCAFQNPSKGRYIHPEENRVISIREGARLQGIPDSWSFVGDRSSIARQIGNGVPIQLAEAVAKSVRALFSR